MTRRLSTIAWVVGLLACTSHMAGGIGADDTANDLQRPPDLTVQLAYQVGPAPECSNWYAGLRKAREWAACDAYTNTNLVKNACQERVQSCARGCDVCPLLAPGEGRPAYFEDLGPLVREGNIVFGLRGKQTIDRSASILKSRLCDGVQWADVLGSTLLHEALHHCHDGYGISDFPSSQTGCAANALERFCTGISSPGGA